MKKTIRKTFLYLILTIAVALVVYVQAPDDMIPVADMDLSGILPEALQQQTSTSSDDQEWYLCESIGDAGETLREAMKERKTKITIMLSGEDSKESDYNSVFSEIYDTALEHTGNGDEGDFLKWHLNKVSVTYAKSTSTFEISVAYLDNASMEEQVAQAIEAVEKEIPVTSEDSTYDKIYAIYDYLANRISYDKEDQSTLPHTAYDAVVNGKAVCQGYATLFYRILLDYGIDNRIIVSDTHAWNLVCVDGQYYECDLTWDSQGVQKGDSYAYFLKADLSGDDAHTWKTQAMDEEVCQLTRSDLDYSGPESEKSGFGFRQVIFGK
jgi:transglutaminase/protease-like cytokinesis protein 3